MNRYQVRRRVVLALLALLAAVASAGTADAHAVLVGSTPSNGAHLDHPPSNVSVQFNEPVEAAFAPLYVTDRTGTRVDVGEARPDSNDRSVVTAGLKPLGPGLYTAQYRVTSLDGHPVQGVIAFTVGANTGDLPLQIPSAPTPTALTMAAALAHGGIQGLAVLLAGLGTFLVIVWWPVVGTQPKGPRRLATVLTLLFVVLGLVEVGIYAMRASGETFSLGLVLQAVRQTRTGWLWLARSLIASLAGVLLANADRLRPGFVKGLGLVPGAVLLLTLTLQSHAMATQRFTPVLADFLHLLALAPWVGGLVGFIWVGATVLRGTSGSEVFQRVVPRFSKIAIGSVMLLVITGVYGSKLHIPNVQALIHTTYGRTLIAKVVLLLPFVALGGVNLIRRGAGHFRRLIWAEVLMAALIFAAAGLLTSIPPAGVEIASRPGGFVGTTQGEGLTIKLRVDPNRIGATNPWITVNRSDGSPEAEASVGLRVSMVEHDMGLQNVDATEASPGLYTAEQVALGMDGTWRFEVVVLTRQGREMRHSFLVPVGVPAS